MEENHPIEVLCDNQAAISIAKSPVHHDKTKHVKVDRHFISEKIEIGMVDLCHTPTQLQVADFLTKALYKPIYDNFMS